MVRLAGLLLGDQKEGRIALRADGNFGARLGPFEASAKNIQKIPASQLRSAEQGESEGFELSQAIPGSLDSFDLVAAWSEIQKTKRWRSPLRPRESTSGMSGCDGGLRGSEGITNRW